MSDTPTARNRCLTIGSAMVDIIATIADRDVERMTLHNATLSFLLVEQGRKIEAESIVRSIGGGGVNVAMALRRLDHSVDVLGKVGEDVDAGRVKKHLDANGIGGDLLSIAAGLPTGSAVLIASHDKDAAIYTQRGANTALTAQDIAAVDFSRYAHVHIAPLSGESSDNLPLIVARASAAGAFTVLNPGIRQITTRSPHILGALSGVDLLALNVREAGALAPAVMAYNEACPPRMTAVNAAPGLPFLMRDGLRVNDSRFSLAWFFTALQDCGARNVLVTNGGDGAYLVSGGAMYHCPVAPAKVSGTAGAGDAFCATLGEGLAGGLKPERALIRAALNAASVVAHPDAQTGLLTAEALAKAEKAAPLKVWSGK